MPQKVLTKHCSLCWKLIRASSTSEISHSCLLAFLVLMVHDGSTLLSKLRSFDFEWRVLQTMIERHLFKISFQWAYRYMYEFFVVEQCWKCIARVYLGQFLVSFNEVDDIKCHWRQIIMYVMKNGSVLVFMIPVFIFTCHMNVICNKYIEDFWGCVGLFSWLYFQCLWCLFNFLKSLHSFVWTYLSSVFRHPSILCSCILNFFYPCTQIHFSHISKVEPKLNLWDMNPLFLL
jgi:hypothetical protein